MSSIYLFSTGRVTSGIYEYDKDEYFAVPLINGKVKMLSILLYTISWQLDCPTHRLGFWE